MNFAYVQNSNITVCQPISLKATVLNLPPEKNGNVYTERADGNNLTNCSYFAYVTCILIVLVRI